MLKDAMQESTTRPFGRDDDPERNGRSHRRLVARSNASKRLRANPDGRLWCVRDGTRHDTKKTLSTAARRQLINIVAHAVGVTVDEDNPSFPAELPESGYRFHAVVPPQSPDGPTFVIRKKPSKVFSLDDYVAAGIMTGEHATFIRQAVANRENILPVGGGTGSGKTTLARTPILQADRSHCRARAYRRGHAGTAGRSHDEVVRHAHGAQWATRFAARCRMWCATCCAFHPIASSSDRKCACPEAIDMIQGMEYRTSGRRRHDPLQFCSPMRWSVLEDLLDPRRLHASAEADRQGGKCYSVRLSSYC